MKKTLEKCREKIGKSLKIHESIKEQLLGPKIGFWESSCINKKIISS